MGRFRRGATINEYFISCGAVNNRSALGGYVMYDKADPALRADLSLSYAYHVPLIMIILTYLLNFTKLIYII